MLLGEQATAAAWPPQPPPCRACCWQPSAERRCGPRNAKRAAPARLDLARAVPRTLRDRALPCVRGVGWAAGLGFDERASVVNRLLLLVSCVVLSGDFTL
eukprot:6180029-Pleurochrysis_carterae.AAC.3